MSVMNPFSSPESPVQLCIWDTDAARRTTAFAIPHLAETAPSGNVLVTMVSAMHPPE